MNFDDYLKQLQVEFSKVLYGCCNGGINQPAAFNVNGKWHDTDCSVGHQQINPYQESSTIRTLPVGFNAVCECGADKTYGPDNVLHSATMPCPLYRAIK